MNIFFAKFPESTEIDSYSWWMNLPGIFQKQWPDHIFVWIQTPDKSNSWVLLCESPNSIRCQVKAVVGLHQMKFHCLPLSSHCNTLQTSNQPAPPPSEESYSKGGIMRGQILNLNPFAVVPSVWSDVTCVPLKSLWPSITVGLTHTKKHRLKTKHWHTVLLKCF